MTDEFSKIIEPKDPLPDITFDELSKRMKKAMHSEGWADLMPVQAKTIPYILKERDLMVQSRTGSGKTGAFVLPMLERLDPELKACQTLVLVPTRELAKQVFSEASKMGQSVGIKSVSVYGGVGYKPQIDAIQQGAQVVVGTPGRILDLVLKKVLSFKKLKILIFDEADRMLSMGFYPDMKEIKKHLPSKGVNGYMFSATYPSQVLRLAGEFLYKPEFLSLSSDRVYVAETEHVYYTVPAMEKDRCLVRIIEYENPSGALIFSNRKSDVHFINVVLERFGFNVDELSADRTQRAREKVMQRLRDGELRFVVATDVAARGIDIPDLPLVIQYEPPEDPESYIHRAGRTGRAGAAGRAITLAAGMERVELDRIAKRFNLEIREDKLPSDKDVADVAAQRLTAVLEAALRNRDNVEVERMQRFTELAKELGKTEEGLQLISMLLDRVYQHSLHGQSEQPSQTEPRRSEPRRSESGGKPRSQSRNPRRRSGKRPSGGRK